MVRPARPSGIGWVGSVVLLRLGEIPAPSAVIVSGVMPGVLVCHNGCRPLDTFRPAGRGEGGHGEHLIAARGR